MHRVNGGGQSLFKRIAITIRAVPKSLSSLVSPLPVRTGDDPGVILNLLLSRPAGVCGNFERNCTGAVRCRHVTHIALEGCGAGGGGRLRGDRGGALLLIADLVVLVLAAAAHHAPVDVAPGGRPLSGGS